MQSQSAKLVLICLATLSFFAPELHAEDFRLRIDPDALRQEITGFGASDAWSIDPAVRLWLKHEPSTIDQLASLLFSQETGIGLSLWRFNIGAGSAQQGSGSNIPDPYRRAELLIPAPGAPIARDKQTGQLAFLQRAVDLGVHEIVAFANSPPIWATKNGLAHPGGMFALDAIGSTNLDMDKLDDFATFLARVTAYLRQDLGLPVTYLSPINEPTWHWTSESQEGNRYNMTETLAVYRATYEALRRAGLAGEVEVDAGEAVEYRAALGDAEIRHLEGKKYTAGMNAEDMGIYSGYINHLLGDETLRPMIGNKISLHGYFSDTTHERLFSLRDAVRKNVDEVSPGAHIWMSEYAILGEPGPLRDFDGHGFDVDDMDYALHVARMIHLDLTRLDATAWFWWLALTPYDYKDGLVKVNSALDPDSLTPSKLLWTYGHFSRFVKPGYQRLEATLDDIEGILASVYSNQDGDKLVVVLVNLATEDHTVTIDGDPRHWQRYLTNADHALDHTLHQGNRHKVPARSIVTIVSGTGQ